MSLLWGFCPGFCCELCVASQPFTLLTLVVSYMYMCNITCMLVSLSRVLCQCREMAQVGKVQKDTQRRISMKSTIATLWQIGVPIRSQTTLTIFLHMCIMFFGASSLTVCADNPRFVPYGFSPSSLFPLHDHMDWHANLSMVVLNGVSFVAVVSFWVMSFGTSQAQKFGKGRWNGTVTKHSTASCYVGNHSTLQIQPTKPSHQSWYAKKWTKPLCSPSGSCTLSYSHSH